MTEYIIVGDNANGKEILIHRVCGDKSVGQTSLEKLKVNPTKYDLECMAGLTNIRLKEVAAEDCWWNVYGTD